MGLFTKRDPCAICGGKVKGLLPWKIEGQLICNDCFGSVDLPGNMVNEMTLEQFKAYRAFREENNLLKEKFQVTQQIDFGWFDTKFVFDGPNRLMCLDKNLNKTIFEGKNIVSFVIKEDDSLLFEGNAEGLRCYSSSVHDCVKDLIPYIQQFRRQVQMEKDMERLMDNGNSENRQSPPTRYFDVPEPFKKFNVEIQFDHAYWSVFTADMNGPSFSNTEPDAYEYLREYDENVKLMENLATAIMEIAYPGAQKVTVGSSDFTNGTAAAPVDAVEEIKRYRALVEQGILTEEEFTAKKRQLLGI